MTLCVAAACQDHRKPRIVAATDWRAEGYVAGADIQDKFYWIGKDIAVLIAGNITRAVHLKDTFAEFLEWRAKANPPKSPITKQTLVDVFMLPPILFKSKIAAQYVGLKYGMTYKAFLSAIAAKQIPQAIAEETLRDISKLKPECELILCMFSTDRSPSILKVAEDGSVDLVDSFATIGFGSYIADGVLFQREHQEDETLGATLYHVYEAMKLGSIAPAVGKEFTINVLYPPKGKDEHVYADVLNRKGIAFMDAQFKKRGPKAFTNFRKLPANVLERDFA